MKKICNMLKNISPFNNREEMPTLVYIAKKLLAFLMLYWVAAVAGEAVIIGTLSAMGYDPLHGVMPEGNLAELLSYYGFVIFLLAAVLYCKVVEKRDLKSLGFTGRAADYLVGGGIAAVLLAAIIGVCCVTGSLSWGGINENCDAMYLVGLCIGLMIQSAAEEVLSRGFLQLSLQRKTSVPVAIFISSTAFAMPHFSTLFEAETKYAIIGVINLYLVSVIFSLLVICRTNLWIACGLHGIWNFILYGIMGLTLSGNEATVKGLLKFEAKSANILNGGVYGLEAGIVTTVILGIAAAVLIYMYRSAADQRH
ncbi:MAG: lysostaphin resistance A-like protein [Roseburia sp.]